MNRACQLCTHYKNEDPDGCAAEECGFHETFTNLGMRTQFIAYQSRATAQAAEIAAINQLYTEKASEATEAYAEISKLNAGIVELKAEVEAEVEATKAICAIKLANSLEWAEKQVKEGE